MVRWTFRNQPLSSIIGYFDHGESRIKVGRASVEPDAAATTEPGTVLSISPTVRVATSEGAICFHELQRPGARMLPVADFLRGYTMAEGDRLVGGTAEALVRKEP